MKELFVIMMLTFVVAKTQAKPLAPYIQLPKVEKTQILDRNDLSTGFNDLLPYILPAPNQGNAGTCLFMAHTGVIEWWLAKLAQVQYPKINGDFDLSERLSANLKTLGTGDQLIENWRTDTIYRFNQLGYSYLNRDYPFTQGWYKRDARGVRVPAREGDQDASYGINYNWIPEFHDLVAPKVYLPKFKRAVFYADPKQNQWNIGGAPTDIVQQVKEALRQKRSPIITIYNHMGYWHTVVILGYNDSLEHNCAYVNAFPSYMSERASQLRIDAENSDDPKTRRKLLGKARKFESRGKEAQNLFKKQGGCHKKGVFYVRDSIYSDKTLPLYDYDPSHNGEEMHYSATVIAREYQWLSIFANHIYQITVQ